MPTQQTKYTVARTDEILDSVIPLVTVVADGSANDAPAIQAEIDRLSALGGGTVVLPLGVIAIASTLDISSSNIRLVGQGGEDFQGAGAYGTQASTTLKWIGTEFDGAVVQSGVVSTADGNRVYAPGGTLGSAEHQGMLIKSTAGGEIDLIMDSGNEYIGEFSDYWDVKPTHYGPYGDLGPFEILKPSVMIEVHAVYGDGATDQQIVGSGVRRINFDCQNSHIGLRVIASNNGVYEDLSFIEPKTSAIYMGCKNIGTMDKPAVVSQDPQFNSFARIYCRNVTSGDYGGLFVCNGVPDWGSNTSFNNFEDMRSLISHGDCLVFGSSDANRMLNCLVVRGAGGTGEALLLLGSNRSANDVPRKNTFTQFASTGVDPVKGQIICYGTDTYTHPSFDQCFEWLNTGNATPLPTIKEGASCYYNTDQGYHFEQKSIQPVIGGTAQLAEKGRKDIGTESLRVVSNNTNHIILDVLADEDDVDAKVWGINVNPTTGNLAFTRPKGTGALTVQAPMTTTGLAQNIDSYAGGHIMSAFENTAIFTGGTGTIVTFPASPTDGQIWTIKNGHATESITVDQGTKEIDGSTVDIVLAGLEWITLHWDGALGKNEFWIIGQG